MATEEDKPNNGALMTLVAVGTFVMIGTSLAVTAITREELGRATAEKEASGSSAYHALRDGQIAKLATSGIPIEQSMQEVVAGLQRDPNSATPPGAATAVPAPTASAAAPGEAAAPAASGVPAAPSAAPQPQGAIPGGASSAAVVAPAVSEGL